MCDFFIAMSLILLGYYIRNYVLISYFLIFFSFLPFLFIPLFWGPYIVRNQGAWHPLHTPVVGPDYKKTDLTARQKIYLCRIDLQAFWSKHQGRLMYLRPQNWGCKLTSKARYIRCLLQDGWRDVTPQELIKLILKSTRSWREHYPETLLHLVTYSRDTALGARQTRLGLLGLGKP